MYASFAMPTELMRSCERYRFYCNVFGYANYALFLGGILVVTWSLRKKRLEIARQVKRRPTIPSRSSPAVSDHTRTGCGERSAVGLSPQRLHIVG